jgi:hypothetical protein
MRPNSNSSRAASSGEFELKAASVKVDLSLNWIVTTIAVGSGANKKSASY